MQNLDRLEDYSLTQNPFESFTLWYQAARQVEENPEAMTLATSSKAGIPSARIVLFKGLIENQFALYGHSCSQKGQELEENPRASLVFYWHKGGRQVRVSGVIHKMPREQVESYFQKRALESQVASAISKQSEAISSRQELEQRFEQALTKARSTGRVDLPETWNGYLLRPTQFEFFLYREHRLNDRFLFEQDTPAGWSIKRLQP